LYILFFFNLFLYTIPVWLPPFEQATDIVVAVGEELHSFFYLDTT